MTAQASAERRPSIRERPARPALSREGIVSAALVILEEAGLGKVTMRRIAASLDTGAASLYVYVRDTEDLHAQVLDALLGSLTPIDARGTWRTSLIGVLERYARLLFKYPEIARMTMRTHPSGPNYLALVDSVLGLLHEGRVPDGDAAWAVDLLLASVTANVVEHTTRRSNGSAGNDFAALSVELAHVDPRTHPNIARVGDDLLSGDGDARFRWALDVLINGVLNTPRRSTGKT
jgi:AcrR family transcriptional regulator